MPTTPSGVSPLARCHCRLPAKCTVNTGFLRGCVRWPLNHAGPLPVGFHCPGFAGGSGEPGRGNRRQEQQAHPQEGSADCLLIQTQERVPAGSGLSASGSWIDLAAPSGSGEGVPGSQAGRLRGLERVRVIGSDREIKYRSRRAVRHTPLLPGGVRSPRWLAGRSRKWSGSPRPA